MNNTRDDGLSWAGGELSALAQDPAALEQARQRFSDPPPSYRSHISQPSTRSPSPRPQQTRESQRERDRRRWELETEHRASCAFHRYRSEKYIEMQRLQKARPWVRDLRDLDEEAGQIVKNRWKEEGIWNDRWTGLRDMHYWAHEDPELAASRAEASEATRPFQQFFHHVSNQRSLLLSGYPSYHRDPRGTSLFPTLDETRPGPIRPDINTEAYSRVKEAWTKIGIWDDRWGVLPGLT